MLRDDSSIHPKQLCHAFLCEPEGLTLVDHLHPHVALGGSVKDDVVAEGFSISAIQIFNSFRDPLLVDKYQIQKQI